MSVVAARRSIEYYMSGTRNVADALKPLGGGSRRDAMESYKTSDTPTCFEFVRSRHGTWRFARNGRDLFSGRYRSDRSAPAPLLAPPSLSSDPLFINNTSAAAPPKRASVRGSGGSIRASVSPPRHTRFAARAPVESDASSEGAHEFPRKGRLQRDPLKRERDVRLLCRVFTTGDTLTTRRGAVFSASRLKDVEPRAFSGRGPPEECQRGSLPPTRRRPAGTQYS
ncbi:unnamed protein product, partial [Iphiclides podalirius]